MPRKNYYLTGDEKKHIRKLLGLGLPVAGIARLTGRSAATIYEVRRLTNLTATLNPLTTEQLQQGPDLELEVTAKLKAAQGSYARLYRQIVLLERDNPVPHGTIAGFLDWGCACAQCQSAVTKVA